MNIISIIFAVLLIVFLGFVIVKNTIGVVEKIKEHKKSKEAVDTPVEVKTDVDIENKN